MSTSKDRRNMFDMYALGVVSFLERSEDCRTVTLQGNDPVMAHDVLAWERKHTPLRLPEDLKRFYSFMNGFSLNWTVEIEDKLVVIGEMRINKLENLSRSAVDWVAWLPNASNDTANTPDCRKCTTFVLDNSCELGDVVLLYRNGDSTHHQASDSSLSQPEVWLLNSCGQLVFICSSFTQYMRLMAVHLGIIGWQGVFTQEGLCETAQQWMSLFCRERLVVDRQFLLNSA